MRRAPSLVAIVFSAVTALAAPAQAPDAVVARVRGHAKFAAAIAALDRDHDRLIQEIITLTEIPAPPFKEDARGAAYLKMMRESGLTDVERDEVGNVIGLRKGTGGGPLIAIAAHLDPDLAALGQLADDVVEGVRLDRGRAAGADLGRDATARP